MTREMPDTYYFKVEPYSYRTDMVWVRLYFKRDVNKAERDQEIRSGSSDASKKAISETMRELWLDQSDYLDDQQAQREEKERRDALLGTYEKPPVEPQPRRSVEQIKSKTQSPVKRSKRRLFGLW